MNEPSLNQIRFLQFTGKFSVTLSLVLVTAPGYAQTKTLIDYFLPTPIVCPLTSNTWGASGVLPRDVCNGLEDSTNKSWQYWDGKILQGPDGKYHMYAGRWPQGSGFADWPNSVIVEAVSNSTLIGSYIPSTTTPFTGKEQNVTGMVLNNGSYALLDSLGASGTGNVYTSSTLADPWTANGQFQITANGSTISTQTTENLTIWASANGSFEIVTRSFQEMVSTSNILGPYVIQATIPSLQSQGYEDPVIWCSGGQYHMVANMYNARKAYHFTSTDGINNWTNKGLAYDPTTNFVRYTDGTVNNWYKMERPGVFLQNGHVTAFTFAVIDVDKTLDLANDTHGTKIIVVPFDGVTFDSDNPGPGSAGCPISNGGTSGTGGASGMGGATATGGKTGAGGTTSIASTGGTKSTGGAVATGGTKSTGGAASTGGVKASGGTSSTGGAVNIATGGLSNAASGGTGAVSGTLAQSGGASANGGSKASGGLTSGGGSSSAGGSSIAVGGVVSTGGANATGGSIAAAGGAGAVATGGSNNVAGSGLATAGTGATENSGSCSCRVPGSTNTRRFSHLALIGLAFASLRRRRPKAPRLES
jgi:hypothetical protein